MIKSAVTGSSGFLGSALVKELESSGREVIKISHSQNGENGRGSLKNSLQNVDEVYHLATLYDRKTDLDSLRKIVDGNILFGCEILSTLNEINPSARFVGASSFTSLNSEGVYSPRDFYSATKYAFEDLAKAFPEVGPTFIRVTDTYGPGDSRPKVQNLAFKSAIIGEVFEFGSSPHQMLRLNHSEDIAKAFIYSAENEWLRGETRNLFFESSEITIGELVGFISGHIGSNNWVSFKRNAKVLPLPPRVNVLEGFSPTKNPHRDLINSLKNMDGLYE